MRKLLLPLLVFVLLLSSCSRPKAPSRVLNAGLKEGEFVLTSNWEYRSRVPIESFYSQMFISWLDQKKMETKSGGKQNQFQEKTNRVPTRGMTTRIPLRETDYNRGRLCFTEVVFFLLEDGSVDQQTFTSNIIDSPKKERHFFPGQSQSQENPESERQQ